MTNIVTTFRKSLTPSELERLESATLRKMARTLGLESPEVLKAAMKQAATEHGTHWRHVALLVWRQATGKGPAN